MHDNDSKKNKKNPLIKWVEEVIYKITHKGGFDSTMNTEEIQIEILGSEFDFVVEFNSYPGQTEIIREDPNDSQQGYGGEVEVINLYCVGYEQGKRKCYDVSYMIDRIQDKIIAELGVQ